MEEASSDDTDLSEDTEELIFEETDEVVAFNDANDVSWSDFSEMDDFNLDFEELEGADMAASCKHSYNITYSSISNEKHQTTKTCSKCGKSSTSKNSHSSDGTKTYSEKDGTYHNVNYKCKYCGQNYTKVAKHSYSGVKCKYCGYINTSKKCNHKSKNLSFEAINSSKHYLITSCKSCGVVLSKREQSHSGGNTISATNKSSDAHTATKNCSKCNQQYTVSESHTFSSGKCKYCGFKKTKTQTSSTGTISYSPRTDCASYNGLGTCFKIGKVDKNKIYAKCPNSKCGAEGYDSTFIKNVKINLFTLTDPWQHYKYNIYHQYVKCNQCGKKYYNLCFEDRIN